MGDSVRALATLRKLRGVRAFNKVLKDKKIQSRWDKADAKYRLQALKHLKRHSGVKAANLFLSLVGNPDVPGWTKASI